MFIFGSLFSHDDVGNQANSGHGSQSIREREEAEPGVLPNPESKKKQPLGKP
jgi:hypothetical protein